VNGRGNGVPRPHAGQEAHSCRLASLEQSPTSRHVCTVTACFLQSSEDSSLQPQFSLTILLCLRSDTRHYGHFNRRSYLLTYTEHFWWREQCYTLLNKAGPTYQQSQSFRKKSTQSTTGGMVPSGYALLPA